MKTKKLIGPVKLSHLIEIGFTYRSIGLLYTKASKEGKSMFWEHIMKL